MDDDEEVPAGCACCLTVIMLPVLFLILMLFLAFLL